MAFPDPTGLVQLVVADVDGSHSAEANLAPVTVGTDTTYTLSTASYTDSLNALGLSL